MFHESLLRSLAFALSPTCSSILARALPSALTAPRADSNLRSESSQSSRSGNDSCCARSRASERRRFWPPDRSGSFAKSRSSKSRFDSSAFHVARNDSATPACRRKPPECLATPVRLERRFMDGFAKLAARRFATSGESTVWARSLRAVRRLPSFYGFLKKSTT